MATTNIDLNQPAYGSTSPTWDQPLNNNATILDKVFGSTTSVSVNTSGTPSYTLISSPNTSGTGSTSQCMRFLLTGALSANQYVLLPTGIAGMWTVTNSTTGTYTVTIGSNNGSGTFAGTTVTLPQGYSSLVYSDGTNVAKADDGNTAGGGGVTSFSTGTTGLTPSGATTGNITLAGTLAVANGGTGLTSPGTSGYVLTSNGSSWYSAPSSGGGLTGGNGITISSGTVAMSGSYTGGFSATGALSAGSSISASTSISAGGSISTTSGNISTSSGNVTASGYVAAGSSAYPRLENSSTNFYNLDFSSNTGISWQSAIPSLAFGVSGSQVVTMSTSAFTSNVTPYANQTSWSLISDRTEKENIVSITDGATRILALKPVNFDWIKTGKADSGFIAQDFQTIYPSNISTDIDGKLRIGLSMNFYADLVSTIQSLQSQVTALEARLTAHNL